MHPDVELLASRGTAGMTPGPALSVVVPSVSGDESILACLSALRAAGTCTPLQVLVADRCGPAFRRDVASGFPEVEVIAAGAAMSIPELRSMAISRARAPAVAVIEDHVIVPPDWARRMLAALTDGADAVGGSVYNGATSTILDRTAFLCEYAPVIGPLPSGPAERIPGNNAVYRRAVLDRYREACAGQWEDALHAAMRRDGRRIECRPEIAVEHRQRVRFGDYVAQRFLYSRSYAGARAATAGAPRRLAMAVASLALPPVLLARIGRHAIRARQTGDFISGLPLLVVFTTVWAAGEALGWLRGAGDALARVR
jgi:hypothetical protein